MHLSVVNTALSALRMRFFELRESEARGRLLVARCDIPAGTVILQERAVASCALGEAADPPLAFDDSESTLKLESGALGRILEVAREHSVDATLLRLLFRTFANRAVPPAAPPGCSPEHWLAKSADGVVVDHSGVGLGLMLAHEELQPPLWAGAVRRAVLMLTALLCDVAGRADLSVDAVFATACRINVNSHGIRDRAAPDHIVGVGLFPTACILNHSCDPSCVFSPNEQRTHMNVRTVRDVRCGEELTVAYVDVMQSRAMRQAELLRTKHFACTCTRCEREAREEREGAAAIALATRASGTAGAGADHVAGRVAWPAGDVMSAVYCGADEQQLREEGARGAGDAALPLEWFRLREQPAQGGAEATGKVQPWLCASHPHLAFDPGAGHALEARLRDCVRRVGALAQAQVSSPPSPHAQLAAADAPPLAPAERACVGLGKCLAGLAVIPAGWDAAEGPCDSEPGLGLPHRPLPPPRTHARALLGPHHEQVFRARTQLAWTCMQTGRPGDAACHFAAAAVTCARVLRHPSFHLLELLGELREALQQVARARRKGGAGAGAAAGALADADLPATHVAARVAAVLRAAGGAASVSWPAQDAAIEPDVELLAGWAGVQMARARRTLLGREREE